MLLRAAKAPLLEKISITPELKLDATKTLLPPTLEAPHVTTLPSLLRAAKASSVEEISITPESILDATEELFPAEPRPQVITFP